MGEAAALQPERAAAPPAGALAFDGGAPEAGEIVGGPVNGRSFAVSVDELMVARARRGDPQALETLYRSFATPVYTLARRLCRTSQDAEDVLQETFLEVVRSIGKFRGAGSLAGWVRKVAASKALMRLRSDRSRGEHEPLDEVLAVHAEGEAVPRFMHHDHRLGDRLDVEAALERLSPAARAVVWLHDVEGYTHEEIGELLGKTASFSKSQLARAYVRLRSTLPQQAGRQPCT